MTDLKLQASFYLHSGTCRNLRYDLFAARYNAA
jgi:hypothetical protein